MALVARVTLSGNDSSDPEDYLSTSLGVIFPDDVTNQHGDSSHSIIYTSPHLPKPLLIDLADPDGEKERYLFSHYLWNSSLLLAEFIEKDTLGVETEYVRERSLGKGTSYDVKGLDILELGAGTALPSILSGLAGACRVVVTDYPAPAIMDTLRRNITRNIQPELSPLNTTSPSILVHGHSWGSFSDPADPSIQTFCSENHHAFDRVVLADCLWMQWQHDNLRRSAEYFLRDTPDARCWVVAGFHTGRPRMAGFFDGDALRDVGLEVENIWEAECNGAEREWSWDRDEDVATRKRWLAVAVLRRTRKK